MNSAIERLLTLRVSDFMSRDVVQVSACQTMGEAAAVFVQHRITGAPVTDESGRCVGILSSVDFVRREQRRGDSAEDDLAQREHQLTQDRPSEPFHIESVAEDSVQSHMTTAVQAIDEHESLLEAARMVCAEHVHRLPVVDEHGHVVGVVSSMDLVAAMIKALEE
jgi:CBS-domain-containing membrane protein